MSYLQIIKGFRKSRCVVDLRTDAVSQLVADRRKRAMRYETLKHTAGKRAVFL